MTRNRASCAVFQSRTWLGDLVSEVDRRADEIVTETLQKYSQIPIPSEELSPDVGERSDLWMVDPLDATSAYLMRAGDHYPPVLMARYQDGKTKLGVVHFPLTGEWFYAQDGCCAWKNGQRLQTRKLPQPSLARSWVEMNQYGDETLETEVFSQLRQGLWVSTPSPVQIQKTGNSIVFP